MSISVGPPLYFEDGSGLFNMLTEEIFSRLDIEYEMIWLPPQRSLLWTNNGIYDGHVSRTSAVKKSLPNLIRVPVNVFDFDFMVYAKDPGLVISGWDSLSPNSVDMINGWKIQ